jgi:hypothetical protein
VSENGRGVGYLRGVESADDQLVHLERLQVTIFVVLIILQLPINSLAFSLRLLGLHDSSEFGHGLLISFVVIIFAVIVAHLLIVILSGFSLRLLLARTAIQLFILVVFRVFVVEKVLQIEVRVIFVVEETAWHTNKFEGGAGSSLVIWVFEFWIGAGVDGGHCDAELQEN